MRTHLRPAATTAPVMRADNSRHLAEATRRRNEQTMARARQALTELEEPARPSRSALSRPTPTLAGPLSPKPGLRDQISARRSTTPAAIKDMPSSPFFVVALRYP